MSAILNPSIDPFSTARLAGVALVALRQIRPDDAAALQAFVRSLSPASRRLRFHAALNELTESALRVLTRVDQRAHVAFVLTIAERGTERIVGEARYVVSCDKRTAEFGIAVAEEFRGLGLAERLMTALIGAARAAGLRWLVGHVLADNARMLAFARHCGFAATTRGGLAPGLVRVERCVERPMVVASQPAGNRSEAGRGTVRRLLATFLPSSLDSAWDFQQF
jgi:RimJ/RimL family protein N-acetyltransferase